MAVREKGEEERKEGNEGGRKERVNNIPLNKNARNDGDHKVRPRCNETTGLDVQQRLGINSVLLLKLAER